MSSTPEVIPFFQPYESLRHHLKLIEELVSSPGVEIAAAAFYSNLRGVVDLAITPAVMIVATTHPEIENLEDALERRGKGQTIPRFEKPADTASALDGLRAFGALLKAGNNPAITKYNDEILRQAAVLNWAAFEILSNDCREIVFNSMPDLLLAETERAEALRSVFNISKKDLADMRASPPEKLGTTLDERGRLASLSPVRRMVSALFGEEVPSIEDPSLTAVANKRHLIVHRRGVIDGAYIRQGGRGKLGDQLRLDTHELTQDLAVVMVSGAELLAATFSKIHNIDMKRKATPP